MATVIHTTPMLKKRLGGWSEAKEGETPTHLLLDKDDFEVYVGYNDKRIFQLENSVTAKEQELARLRKEYDHKLTETQAECERKLDEMREKLEKQISLNENLLRISRERANADRKLRPKKEHTGYVVLSSVEKPTTLGKHDRFDADHRIGLWETTVQTPHTVDLPEPVARDRIEYEFLKQRLICELGIQSIYMEGLKELTSEDKKKHLNCCLEWHIRANYKAGYWELIFTHTKPLDVVPEHMRQPKKEK